MTAQPIAYLRDNFTPVATAAPTWEAVVTGSATLVQTGGQMVATLPNATAGSHLAYLQSQGTYDLTGDGTYINIAQMVATGVVASASFDLVLDSSNLIQWRQLSNAITARKTVAGVDTQLFTATWSATTYKYLRIRESGGAIFFDSSTNGTSWTNRASIVGLPFAVTSLFVQFGASCGNVASPGALKVEDINLILPALSTTWHYTQVEWALSNRFKTITIAASSGQGYIATSPDGTTWTYYSGPIGSASGGYNQLYAQSTQAAAQDMAVNLPLDGRWDLPSIVECRFIRLYHRSTSGSSYTLREYYPRRLVQSDDMEAESIRAINISAGAVTADKISVLDLSAITASIGQLTITSQAGLPAWIYQGTGTGTSPTTGLKIFNSGGIGKLSTYNAGVEQVTFDTDGKLKAGAGTVTLDASGVGITGPTFSYGLYNASPVTTPRVNMIQWSKSSGSQAASIIGSASAQLLLMADKITLAIPLSSSDNYGLNLQANGAHSLTADTFTIGFGGATGPNAFTVQTNALTGGSTSVLGGLNVGTATGAGAGQISTSGSVGVGIAAQSNTRLTVKAQDTGTTNYAFYVYDSATAMLLSLRDDGQATIKAAAWIYSSDERLKEHIKPLDRGLADVLALRPVAFDYRAGTKDEWGFLAQDVRPIMPELVSAGDDGYLGLKTTSMIPVLVRAIQDLNTRLEKAGL